MDDPPTTDVGGSHVDVMHATAVVVAAGGVVVTESESVMVGMIDGITDDDGRIVGTIDDSGIVTETFVLIELLGMVSVLSVEDCKVDRV